MSSFAYLKDLPVDFLKIAGPFVRDMLDERSSAAIVEAVTRVAQTMGIRTIAEYVENNTILERLEGIEVDYAQGWATGVPRPLHEEMPIRSIGGTAVSRDALQASTPVRQGRP